VEGVSLPTPFALIAMSPLRFFRYPMRFAVLVGFGTALLAASLLQSVYGRLGRTAGRAAVATVALAILATRAWHLSGPGIAEFTGQTDPAYEMVARVAVSKGPGPLLELPMIDPLADKDDALGSETEAMLGSTRHWLPLIAGFTGYQPPHRPLVLRQAERLPDAAALQRLVDLTHVRWILLRPVDRWPEAKRKQREEIRKSRLFSQEAARSGWVLLRVKTKARNDKWYATIAAGPASGQTLLGTSLAPIAEDAAVAVLAGSIPAKMTAGRAAAVTIAVQNAGTAPWPVSAAEKDAAVVRLLLEWWPADGDRSLPPLATQSFWLPLDFEPGDQMTVVRWVKPLDQPGEYDVGIRVQQDGGASFASPGSAFLSGRVRVEARAGT